MKLSSGTSGLNMHRFVSRIDVLQARGASGIDRRF
jgi:hypothetical protein